MAHAEAAAEGTWVREVLVYGGHPARGGVRTTRLVSESTVDKRHLARDGKGKIKRVVYRVAAPRLPTRAVGEERGPSVV